jgi:hypothetical protein
MLDLWSVAGLVLVMNLPFGYWRAGVPKFSRAWFVAVHAPVLLVVALRLLSGLGWNLANVPVLVTAFVAGQLFGGRWRKRTPQRS